MERFPWKFSCLLVFSALFWAQQFVKRFSAHLFTFYKAFVNKNTVCKHGFWNNLTISLNINSFKFWIFYRKYAGKTCIKVWKINWFRVRQMKSFGSVAKNDSSRVLSNALNALFKVEEISILVDKFYESNSKLNMAFCCCRLLRNKIVSYQ